MGLFKAADGRKHSWLGAIFCCGATVDDDELQPGIASVPSGVCNEQPFSRSPISSMRSVRTWEPLMIDVPSLDTRHHIATFPEHPGFHRSNDIDAPSALPHLPAVPGPRIQSTNASSLAPTHPRLLNSATVRKESLVPLRLGPVVLRDLPKIDANDLNHFDRALGLVHCRSDSWGSSLSHDNSVKTWPRGAEAAAVKQDNSPPSIQSSTTALQRLPSKSSTPSLISQRSSEKSRKLQKRSATELRRTKSDRLDQEILELNTIVREHKSEASRTGASDQHVAAVAPSMQIMARSETLDDIGSALSKPLAAQSKRDPTRSGSGRLGEGQESQYPIRTDSWSNSPAADWLYNFLRSSSPTRIASESPCYELEAPEGQQQQQQQREQGQSHADVLMSDRSSGSSAFFSPNSSWHSRSVTEESRSSRLSSPITPRSSRRGFEGTRPREKGDLGPSEASVIDEVGVAL